MMTMMGCSPEKNPLRKDKTTSTSDTTRIFSRLQHNKVFSIHLNLMQPAWHGWLPNSADRVHTTLEGGFNWFILFSHPCSVTVSR
jgi:hypothetical protein